MDVTLPGQQSFIADGRRHDLDRERLYSALQSLMRRYLDDNPESAYLRCHAERRYLEGHVRTFCRYAPGLPASGDLLDWGCHHAPDSCLLQTAFPGRFRLHACDLVEPQRFARFHKYAGLEYRQLTEIVATPYTPGSFDAVIGSGVLEHVAMDYESLKEMHRILRPGGTLVITYLPNRLSWQEWERRVIRKRDFHQRCYGITEARQLLKRAGFLPSVAEYAMYSRSALFPLKFLCSTLTIIARKVHGM